MINRFYQWIQRTFVSKSCWMWDAPLLTSLFNTNNLILWHIFSVICTEYVNIAVTFLTVIQILVCVQHVRDREEKVFQGIALYVESYKVTDKVDYIPCQLYSSLTCVYSWLNQVKRNFFFRMIRNISECRY